MRAPWLCLLFSLGCPAPPPETCAQADQTAWYRDADGDGHGTALDLAYDCTQPQGYTTSKDDCNDADVQAHPGADERCNEADDDCDGSVDEDPIDPGDWCTDADADGFGDPAACTTACSPTDGQVGNGRDCDDSNPTRSPGLIEDCENGQDDDCDGQVDGEDLPDCAVDTGGSDSGT